MAIRKPTKTRWHESRQAALEMNTEVAVMLDTRGREIRTKHVEQGKATLERGGAFLPCTAKIALVINTACPSLTRICTNTPTLVSEFCSMTGKSNCAWSRLHPLMWSVELNTAGVLKNSKGVNLPDNENRF